jgi:hypothetical protein
MNARSISCSALQTASSILTLALFTGVASTASADVMYEYRSTCDSITVPGVVSLIETIQCSDLPSDAISVTVIVRDSYIPGTSLTSNDVLSVVYRDPYPFSVVFDHFGPGDINGFLPASSGGEGALFVTPGAGLSDIALRIFPPPEGWSFFLLNGDQLHFANGPPGVWIVAEPSALALTLLAMFLIGIATPTPLRAVESRVARHDVRGPMGSSGD